MAAAKKELVSLGEAITRIRERKHITVELLAETVGIGQERLRALESGRLDPPYDLLVEVADGLDAGVSELVGLGERLDAGERP